MYSKILIVGRDSEEVMWELWSGEQGILGTEEGCQFLNVLLLFPESQAVDTCICFPWDQTSRFEVEMYPGAYLSTLDPSTTERLFLAGFQDLA